MNEDRPGGFSDVDHQDEATFYITILEAQDREPGIMRARSTALEALDPKPGERILDAGCGLGVAAIEIASRTRPGGSVVAIDISEKMLIVARKKAKEAGVDVEFAHGDVTALDFAGASFDAARSERVFQHLTEPERALAEMIRVVRPGGRVVVVDTDWDSYSTDIPDQGLMEKLRAGSLRRFASPTVGRRLYGMFMRAGLRDVAVEAIAVVMRDAVFPGTDFKPGDVTVRHAVEDGALTDVEAAAILKQMHAAEADGTTFMSLMMYVVSGAVA